MNDYAINEKQLQLYKYHPIILLYYVKYVLWQIRQVENTAWQVYSWITFHVLFTPNRYSTSTYKNIYKLMPFNSCTLANFFINIINYDHVVKRLFSHTFYVDSFHRPTENNELNQLHGLFLSFSNAAINIRTSYSLLIWFCVEYRFMFCFKDTRLCVIA